MDVVLRPRLDERLQRHEAFWKQGAVTSPLLHVWLGLNFLSDASGYVLPEGPLSVANVGFTESVDLWRQSLPVYESVGDDAFRLPVPFYLMAWMEAILGCQATGRSNTVWVQHRTGPWEEIVASLPPLDGANPWFDQLLHISRLTSDPAREIYPAGGAFLRGPVDVMAELLGFDRVCLEMHDNPRRVLVLADRLAELTIAVGRAQLAAVVPFQGRFFGTYKGVLAPGSTIITSADFAVMLSAGQFRDFFLPSYRKVFAAFDYSCLHLHSAAVHLVDEVLAIEELRAVEFTIDPLGPTISDMVPVFKRVQERKPLIIAELTERDLYDMALTLSPRGLLLSTSVEDIAQAQSIVRRVRR